MGNNYNNQKPVPEAAYKLLESFVGKWDTTGSLTAGPESVALPISGTDTYEWLPGGFFLFHRVDVMVGADRKESIEIIGYDQLSDTYPMHYYDNAGESGIMHAVEEDGVWAFLSHNLRFTGGFSDDGNTLSGVWEQLYENEVWHHLMNIKLSRTS